MRCTRLALKYALLGVKYVLMLDEMSATMSFLLM
jgi:hypothetical protein